MPVIPQTKAVIVYSPGQARVRRVIVPHDDSQVVHHTSRLLKGEAVVVVSLALCQRIGHDALLQHILGKPAKSDRCAVVSGGKAIGFTCADPTIDSHPQGTLHGDPDGKLRLGDGVFHQGYVAPTVKKAG